MLPVTTVATAVLAMAFVGLAFLVIGQRRAASVALGDGGADGLRRAIRAQGNFGEYAIWFVALLGLAEANGAPWPWLALLALVFGLGRVAHAYGLIVAEPGGRAGRWRWRRNGMVLTFVTLSLAAATAVAMLAVRLMA